MNANRNGEVITFFSFKGGTGRTMALANVAWILASRGKRVLVVDWDLDSPGLHKFFLPFLDVELFNSTSGVVDIISDYSRAATHGDQRGPDWHLPYARTLPHAVSLDWPFPDNGTVDIISAGRPGRSYTTVLSGFNWDNFYFRLGGGLLFSAMRDNMRENYDYTLIDSRTGLSDIASICTVRFPDIVVNCFTLSGQSIEGAALVAHSIDDLVEERDIRILPVPMRVEDAEQQKLENGRALARQKFAAYPSGLDLEGRRRYWNEVEVPYKPYYAYEEVLATFGDEPGNPSSLLSAYERLTSVITNGTIQALAPQPDDTRRRFASAFERRSVLAPPDIFISHVAEDRPWAEWLSSVLQRAGARVIAQGADFTPGASVAVQVRNSVSAAGYTIVLLSSSYVRSPQANALWTVLAATEASTGPSRLLPLRVAEVPPDTSFDEWTTIDLARLDEASATDVVLRGLDLHTRPSPDGSAGTPIPRFPGVRPPVWSVPARNAAFTGRSPLLQRLRDTFMAESSAARPQAVHGLSGIGKTQLATEYAHRFMADYDLVWWISAQQEELVEAAIAEIAPSLGIRSGANITDAADGVREALRRGQPYSRWLLIFDNVESPEVITRHIPQGSGHVLITSRNPAWTQLATPTEVEAFTREESVEHLTRRARTLGPDDANRVAQLLGDLPLAIELASAWLETTGMPVEEYLQLLDERLTEWLERSQAGGRPSTAAATWRVSIEHLRQEWPAAVRLLELCSCFGPEPISMNLLYSDETIKHLLPYDDQLQEKMVLGRIIREIGRFALARVDQARKSIQVHRLVQAVIREHLTPEQIEETRHEVHRILVSGRPDQGDVDHPGNWPRYNQIWPHLGPSLARECTEEVVRGLLVERVRYLWSRGEYDEGLALARELEALWVASRGPADRQLLYLQFHIANITRSQGNYKAALEIGKDVLARQTAAFGKEFVHTLLTATALTADLAALGQFAEAVRIARETTDSFTRLYGEEHQFTLRAANNLALSQRLAGDFAKAREIDRRTLALRQQVLGPDHPQTLSSATNLGRDLREAGDFAGSTALLRSTLERCRTVLGEDFPETLRLASSLSVSLRKSGQHTEAHALSVAVLERYTVLYRPDHPDTLACQLNLACDLSAIEESERALEVSEATCAAYERLFGPDQQFSLVSNSNRAIYLRRVGRIGEGLELAEGTLHRMSQVLGEHHPLTLVGAMNLGCARADGGDVDGAERVERATVEALSEVLGPAHPDALFCACNLAVTLRTLGHSSAASDLMQRSLSDLERVLGASHPHLDYARRWRRINLDLEPQTV